MLQAQRDRASVSERGEAAPTWATGLFWNWAHGLSLGLLTTQIGEREDKSDAIFSPCGEGARSSRSQNFFEAAPCPLNSTAMATVVQPNELVFEFASNGMDEINQVSVTVEATS